jgi:ABC-type multidrug transport system fused ATPase/permease subunit
MLLDRPLLILDEANASVDDTTEAVMDRVVSQFVSGVLGPVSRKRRTLLVVAHRLAGVLALDQVVVLRAGKLLESGSPSELLEKKHGHFAGMVKQ